MPGYGYNSRSEKLTQAAKPSRQSRRAATVYDKMEEARARRAALLEGGQTANRAKTVDKPLLRALPRVASASAPKARAEPIARTEPPVAIAPRHQPDVRTPEIIATPVAEPAPQPRNARLTTFLSGAFSLLLLVLGGLAYGGIDRPVPEPAPDFAPPRVSLLPNALGEPLLLSLPTGPDDAVPRPALEALEAPEAERAPEGRSLAARGPQLADSITSPVAPEAQPAGIFILTGSVRPKLRP